MVTVWGPVWPERSSLRVSVTVKVTAVSSAGGWSAVTVNFAGEPSKTSEPAATVTAGTSSSSTSSDADDGAPTV